MPKYLSGRVKLASQGTLGTDRYQYVSLNQVEPNLGSPPNGGDIVPDGQQYQIISFPDYPGRRYWVPVGGGLIPGSITVFDEGSLVGGISSTTQLTFVGAAVSAFGITNPIPGIGVTIRIFAPGNNGELLFNSSNDFGTSSLLTFSNTAGILTAGNSLNIGLGGTIFTVVGVGSVGIKTANPTQELDLNGNLRLRGTIYDYNNQPGNPNEILVKNNFGGLTWINQSSVRAGAGGTYRNVQFHNNVGLVDGAPNFVYDEVNQRVGIGSTIPTVTLDVLGISSFKGQTTVDFLNVTGVTTSSTLNVTGITTTRGLIVSGVSTLGFITGTSAYFTGIITANKFNGSLDIINDLYVSGFSTFKKLVYIDSNLGVTGLTTLSNLKVSGISTFDSQVDINNLNVTGVGTFDNIKIDANTIYTTSGNLILDSTSGTTQIDDKLYVNDTTDSDNRDNGSIVTEGGVGIEKNLNVGGSFRVVGVTTLAANGGITTTGGDLLVGRNLSVAGVTTLAANGGITTTGGDLYIGGNLNVKQSVNPDFVKTNRFQVTGISSLDSTTIIGGDTIINNGPILQVSGINSSVYIGGNIGLGSTNPTSKLYIVGDTFITGFTTLGTGATSRGTLFTDRLSVAGFSTFVGLVTSRSTLFTNQLSASGFSTFVGLVTSRSTLFANQLSVAGVSTFNGNVILGDENSDLVTFNSRVNSSIIPSAPNTYNLGASGFEWNNVSAQTFNGKFVGTADNAVQVSTGTTTGTSSYYITFVNSNNDPRENEFLYTDSEITYNPSTDLLSVGKLYVSGISTFNSNSTFNNNILVSGIATFSNNATFNGNVIFGDANSDLITFNSRVNSSIIPSDSGTLNLGSPSNLWGTIYTTTIVGSVTGIADTAKQLQTSRNFSINGTGSVINAGDVSASAVSFNGTQNVVLNGSLKNVTGLTSGTYGDSTTIPVVSVNAQGIVTSITTTGVNFSAATVQNADNIKTTSSTSSTLYPTFVDSNNVSPVYEAVYTDNDITYDASDNLLTLGKLNLSNTTSSTITAILTRGFDQNFQLSAQNGTGSNASGQEVSRFGINYSGSSWNSYFKFIRGDGAADGSIVIATNNTDRVRFDSSGNVLPQGVSGTLNLGSDQNRWNTFYVNTIVGSVTGIADTAKQLQTARNIAITGDLTWSVNFDGSANVTSTGTLANTTVTAGTYGSSTQVGILTVDSKGRVTAASNVAINFSTATVLNADNIKTISATSAGNYYLTFVSTNSDTGAYQSVYTDSNIIYNPSTDQLTLSKIKPTSILDSNGSGSQDYIIVANGSGGWNWTSPGNIGGLQTLVNNAQQSATNAANSATAASNSATAASNSETNASNSATNAANSATGASNSATAASNSASAASNSATNASNSATNAANSATGASNSATNASNSATNAANSASGASGSAAAAAASAASAQSAVNSITTGNFQTSGNIFIRNTAPTIYLQDTDNRSSMIHCNSNNFYVLRGDGNDSTTFTTFNGYWPLQIDLNNNDALFGGNVTAVADVTAFSDIKLKKNVKTLKNALEKTIQLRGVEYDRKDIDCEHQIGVIAQEVEKIIPELVTENKDGIKSVSYQKITAVLIEAIKEQQEIITNLKERIEILEKK